MSVSVVFVYLLQSLIPEIKTTVLTSDPILDLGVMDGSLSDTEEDKRDIKIKRTVVQVRHHINSYHHNAYLCRMSDILW